MDSAPRYMGMRGARLKAAMIIFVVAPSFLLFGYNNGSTGGILTLESFVQVFLPDETFLDRASSLTHRLAICTDRHCQY
jgi:hypothetical protein